MDGKPPKENTQIEIVVDEEVADGIYSNVVVINQTISEFILDFINILPGVKKTKVKSRIILTPLHAKRLFKMLETSLTKFEQDHGSIQDKEKPKSLPFNLNPVGEA